MTQAVSPELASAWERLKQDDRRRSLPALSSQGLHILLRSDGHAMSWFPKTDQKAETLMGTVVLPPNTQ